MSGSGERTASAGDDHEGIAGMLFKGNDIEISECDKTGNVRQRWLHRTDDSVIPVEAHDKHNGSLAKLILSWRQAALDAFLPIGFPHSVSDDYLAYQTFDSLQAFFSTITSLLASRALLEGLGVGDASSSATFAMLLTIFKDAMSRVATIVFAHRFGLRIEPDAKRYRFLADLFNDTAFFLELFSPLLGTWPKVLAIGAGEALRALCGVAAGASKAALSVHFAKHDNLAELNAKEASQETAVGLVGLLVGTVVVKLVEDHRSVIVLMTLLVIGHLWVNYLGVCSVHMTTLNRQRATILFQTYLRTGKVLSPREVAGRENILFWDQTVRSRRGLKVARIEFAESYLHGRYLFKEQSERFVVDGPMHTKFIATDPRTKLTTIRILLWDRAEAEHAILAWFLSLEIAWMIEKDNGYSDRLDQLIGRTGEPADKGGSGESNGEFEKRCYDPVLWEKMAAVGWNLGSQAFETGAPVRVRFHIATRKND